jgi:hypothetical protein
MESRAPIKEGVEKLDHELYQMLLEVFMSLKPHSRVLDWPEQEREQKSERTLGQLRITQRHQNKQDWIDYYEQRIAQAVGLVEYYEKRLAYVRRLKPDASPPRRGSIVTHTSPESRNGHRR